MKPIIEPVDVELIKSELTPDKFLRYTNKANNEIYVTTAAESPNIMREIARLREVSFRAGGGGSGNEIDMDEFDTMENPYKQLFVWDPQSEKIIGGYRYIHGKNVKIVNGQPHLATAELYHFSDKYIQEYLPQTIELARSFVQPDYQSTVMGAKSLFALDNLWDGLGALFFTEPEFKYFFGKVTIYSQYDAIARDLIFGFIEKHFGDKEDLIHPHKPFIPQFTQEETLKRFTETDLKEDYKLLNAAVRERGVNIPPLVNAYIGLTDMAKSFGYAIYEGLGNVVEFGLTVPIDHIYEAKTARHLESFQRELEERKQQAK